MDPVTISALILGGSTLMGGLLGSSASKSAAETQAEAANKAAETQWRMYEQSRADLAPWRATGEQAVNRLRDMVFAGPGGYEGYGNVLGHPPQGTPQINYTPRGTPEIYPPSQTQAPAAPATPGGAYANMPEYRTDLYPISEIWYDANGVRYADQWADAAGNTYEISGRPVDMSFPSRPGMPAGTPPPTMQGVPAPSPAPAAPVAPPASSSALVGPRGTPEVAVRTAAEMGTTSPIPQNAIVPRDPVQAYQKSPYYDFLLEQGTRGLERGAAARGMQLSGAENQALVRFGQNLASQDYDNWLRRWYQSLTPLQSMAGLGQTSAGQTASAGIQTGVGVGQNILAGGEARAAGQLGQANAFIQPMNWAAGQYAQYNMLQNLMGPQAQAVGGYPTNALAANRALLDARFPQSGYGL